MINELEEDSSSEAILATETVVKRTFAWLGRHRRMSKDYEYLTEMSEAFIYAAMVRLMVRRLSQTTAQTG